ncbi:MAG: class II histone deacetylase [Actinobacteria bacterium]|nr:class II histone deacetylase [Actinomycetota bacterium]
MTSSSDSPPGPARRTALVWHERFAWYEAGIGAGFAPAGGLVQPYEPVDAPAAKARLRSLVDVCGLSEWLRLLTPTAAGEDALRSFHDDAYLERLRQLDAAGSGDAGEAAPVGPDAYETARLGVGACLLAVDEVVAGDVDNAYALVRPPGHHARRGEGVGSCLLANAVLAAHHARDRHGIERIAIVDWDVHHGNGAQEAFWDDPDVLTLSIHQEGYFPPGSGALDELGGPAALGANLNVPLPPGSGHAAYLQAAHRIVAPALRDHRPELILVCSGYDAAAMDPMGRMLLHSDSFRELTRVVKEVAEEQCEGRLVVIQEGGYSPAYTPFCGVAVIEELVGVRVCEDPFIDVFRGMPGQEATPEQLGQIEAAARVARLLDMHLDQLGEAMGRAGDPG